MQIKPLNRHLLVEVTKIDEVVSNSGIVVSTEKDIAVEKGKVLASSPDCTGHVKLGDTVYYKHYNINTVKIGDKEFNFLKEDEVLGHE